MKVNNIGANRSFKGIHISESMPREIIKAIKSNPVIKKAGKNYALYFTYDKNRAGIPQIAGCTMTTPNIDPIFNLITTPPHSILTKYHYLGRRPNGILKSLEEIRNTPDFFEQKLGKPRTLKQRITAFFEAFKIAAFPLRDRSKEQNEQLHNIVEKYRHMNIPQNK